MAEKQPRSKITLNELLVLVAVAGVLVSVLAVWVQAARMQARINYCSCTQKQIGLGILNYESNFKRYPALTSQQNPDGDANIWTTAPGAASPAGAGQNGYLRSPADVAGYSWMVLILPYLECQVEYQDMATVSNGFTQEAFASTNVLSKALPDPLTPAGNHFATLQLDFLTCPGFLGNSISTASSGTAAPAVNLPSYAALYKSQPKPRSGVAITNYVALSATHLACMATAPDEFDNDNRAQKEPANGVIVPGKTVYMRDILDGRSKTLMICETKEPAVNCWYDGTVAWCVGANPNGPQPTRPAIKDRDGKPTAGLDPWTAAADGTTAVNVGPGPQSNVLYAPNGTTRAQTQPVCWGPSSDHPGGIVLHIAADGSIHSITQDIDPTLYLRLITRAGHEQAVLPD